MTADGLRVRGAGPMLAYEIVGPPAASDGEGAPTLLCVHGNSSHRGMWRPVAHELRGFRSLLLDLRGHGNSEHVDPPAYNPGDHAEDIARVVASLALGTYAILAHSAGALAAARFIAATGPRATVPGPAAFVWVDIDPCVPRPQVAYFHERAMSVARVFSTIEDALRGFRRLYPNVPGDRLRAFVTEGLRPTAGGWRLKLDAATYATWEPGDLGPDLPRITCPTLVLRGAESLVTSAEGLAALRRGLSRPEIHEIAGGSHLLLLEHPAIVAGAIREFLLPLTRRAA